MPLIEWNLTAYDSSGSQVDFISSGDLSGTGNSFPNSFFGVGDTLRVEAQGQISQVVINTIRKIGFDTFSFAGAPAPPNGVIPEPSTLLLFGTGLAGLAAWRYRKSVKV